jgi:hypothetical protein|nr:MAG TPA: hypothetical protein [Caudoviricetes sp.]
MFPNDKTIKEITIKSGDQEIKLEDVSSLTIGNFIITPKIMYDITSMSEYNYSEDTDKMIDKVILDSFELPTDNDTTMRILDEIRSLYIIRDFLRSIEKGKAA